MSEDNRSGNGPLSASEGTAGSQGGVEEARERFSRLATQVRDRAQQVGGAAGERARRAAGDLRRGAGIARERVAVSGDTLREGYHQAEARARVLSGDVNDFVQASPARAVLLAAGIGFLVGLLVRRRD